MPGAAPAGICPKADALILARGPLPAHSVAAILTSMGHPLEDVEPHIIGGPTPIQAPRVGDLYRWKVQHGRAEKHVYVQIASALEPDAFEEPLRSGIQSKGESVLGKLLERGNVPTRIKISSGGITEVGTDRRSRPCSV
jgi:hypothetical protein